MIDLHTRVLAELDRLRALAEAATPGPWSVDNTIYAESIYGGKHGDTAVVAGGRWGGEASVFDSTEDALHIAAWSPAAVLRLIGALREIAQRHSPAEPDKEGWIGCRGCGIGGDYSTWYEEWPCENVTDVVSALGLDLEEDHTDG